ncbi:MAG: LytTR family DNA-binding domain-containing protein [Bacteroidota bacterium]
MNSNKTLIRAAIIEDEPNNRELLIELLANHCEGIELAGVADGVASGIDMIKEILPDVLFLDIELEDGNGFDLIDAFPACPFRVVFVTGYDMYAIKAIKYSALDYLLKPIDLAELREAVKKIVATGASASSAQSVRFFRNTHGKQHELLDRLVLPGIKSHRVVSLDDIVSVSAEADGSRFRLDDGLSCLTSYPLSYYESILPEHSFFRIHRSHIVHLAKVVRFDAGRVGLAHLSNGHSLEIAARRKKSFLSALKQRRSK